ncbi:TRAP transporter permease [Bordetella hinzii]|uniref:C4-dicarboxylate ABC transporter permease n=1 Tax=Bordetella hinzii TaxID=103855 RepID=A0AAN1RVI1_9BORD|nr:TRAP transporter permease [Bordetella hinzii]AKQ57842.1 Sialic acid TRAP transporter permease protein SiaT [Bordetella hinzii]AKQ62308.1 Sialic acid TRAP transporter permease protein SiaT [Bordetella hinzii]AZW16794.1 C4-dicarboxylate ABC transporter permease [Bordetella hinzii]KCB29826.1 TRAP transporter, 4TM/12TM fusion protein [Bordetella hinzii CA90 BAL1384]KCB33846.1 TRAP transporter, 4TM/12TM fusion protein [Bordetella hinzii L60]
MEIDHDKTQKLAEKYDAEIRFRPLDKTATWIVSLLLVTLSIFHYYTAGFGLLREATHRGVHLAFVLSLIFLVFGFSKAHYQREPKSTWYAPGGVPLYDWIIAIVLALSVLYIPYIFEDLAFRVGNPLPMDVAMGTVLILGLLEGTRRAMGWPLPIIALVFLAYAAFGPWFPGLLKHAGNNWSQIVNHMYLTSQGIYGVAVGVVATYVFHFVLFGVLATRIGLGQLFLDIASTIAGRYAGGPAKVSVFGSAMFGMLSGSSVANAVTVGSLTIPAMIRIGYPRHFAGGVEAASSTGGQITPPIMGAAAFLMIEFLGIPYQDIAIAGIFPAFLYFFGMFMQVHFEAKREGLRGLTAEEMPKLRASFKMRWPTLIPLVLLIGVLASGRTPYLAAFAGITGCIVVGLLNPFQRLRWRDLYEAFETGAKYALAVGAAAGTVGLVIGVVTLTGVGFKISYIVIMASQAIAGGVGSIIPDAVANAQTLTLIAALVMTGVVCVLMGCGVPTTANYLIMVAVAAPTLVQLGVQPIAAHFFVFYFGILADITPPVALAAYAAAGMAGSDPLKTSVTAFRLGITKLIVPFVFVFSPSLLISVKGFTWYDFSVTLVGCMIGLVLLSAAFSRYFLVLMKSWERWLFTVGAFLTILPGALSGLIGLAICIPAFISQWQSWAQEHRPRTA